MYGYDNEQLGFEETDQLIGAGEGLLPGEQVMPDQQAGAYQADVGVSPTPDYAPIVDALPDSLQDVPQYAEQAKEFLAESQILSTIEEFAKSQRVRMFDVTVLGPLLMWWAFRGKLTTVERGMLGVIGLGTVIYNARNWLKNKETEIKQDMAGYY